ncbi:hypothetical protein DMH17_05035 [Raoultella planticola]|nr:hypothetical protein [Raoultella planticola]
MQNCGSKEQVRRNFTFKYEMKQLGLVSLAAIFKRFFAGILQPRIGLAMKLFQLLLPALIAGNLSTVWAAEQNVPSYSTFQVSG